MASLTYQDLERYLGREFNSSQQIAATTIIAMLERQLSNYLKRPLSPAQYIDEVHWMEVGQKQIFLKNAPVINVSSFYIGLQGHEVEQDLDDFMIKPWGIDNILITGTNYRALVTYTGGISNVDALALEEVIYSAATREMNKVLLDAQGLSELTVEGSKYVFAEGGLSGFTDHEMKFAKRFKRYSIR